MTTYSKEWIDLIAKCESHKQCKPWQAVLDAYFTTQEKIKEDNLVIFNEGIWIEISNFSFTYSDITFKTRKIRGISKSDIFYDGCYSGINDLFSLGSWEHIYRIDGHELDLRENHDPYEYLAHREDTEAQRKLIEFIRKYSEKPIFMPEVPSGILKLPDSFQ